MLKDTKWFPEQESNTGPFDLESDVSPPGHRAPLKTERILYQPGERVKIN